MKTIAITNEIKNEILKSIEQFNKLIKKENNFSYDLRKHDKVALWSNKVKELEQALINGYL